MRRRIFANLPVVVGSEAGTQERAPGDALLHVTSGDWGPDRTGAD